MLDRYLELNCQTQQSYDRFSQNPQVAAEIEMAIREKAGVISKKIEGNPLSPEKIEKEKKVAEKEEAEKEATPPKKNQN